MGGSAADNSTVTTATVPPHPAGDIANYCLPKTWPADRVQRAKIIGDWLQTEVRFLVL